MKVKANVQGTSIAFETRVDRFCFVLDSRHSSDDIITFNTWYFTFFIKLLAFADSGDSEMSILHASTYIIYWWISKSNSSKESCCEVEYEAYDKIHMWRISIVFLHILIFYLIISNQRHSIIYWWISKSNSSKDSCCEV